MSHQVGDSNSVSKGPLTAFRALLLLCLKVSVGFASALFLWEVILRFALESNPGSRYHPELGKIERSGTLVQSWEGFGRVQLNSLGMRTEEISPKGKDEYRILLLGDSFTRADEVSDQQHFATLLAEQMATYGTDGLTTNVINAGKPGTSPANYLHASSFHHSTIEPDSVVVQLTTDDFSYDLLNSSAEFYVEPNDESFHVVRNEVFNSGNSLASALIDKWPLFQRLTQLSVFRVGGKQVQRSVATTGSELSPSAMADQTDALDVETAAPDDEAVIDWTLTQLKQTYPELVIVYIPAINYFDVQERNGEILYEREAAIEKHLIEKVKQHNISFVNLKPDFIEYYQTHKAELRGFHNTQPGLGHLNASGHRLLAQRLVEQYQSQFSHRSHPSQ